LLDHYLEMGSQPGMSEAYVRLGDVELAVGDTEAAVIHYERALTIAREANALGQVVGSLIGLGRAALRRGDARQAVCHFAESLALDRDWHHTVFALPVLEALAGALTLRATAGGSEGLPARGAADADRLRAARLLGAAEAVRDRLGLRRPPQEQSEHDAWIATLRATLSAPQFTAVWEAGQALSWEEMMACALDVSSR
jgi:tetratricopeptide (TPR) repeat protein